MKKNFSKLACCWTKRLVIWFPRLFFCIYGSMYGLSISVTHVLALVTRVLALACWHLLQCIFDLLPLNIYSWGHHPLKCFFKALENALETVVAVGRWSECIFLNKRNAFGDVETYPGLKTEPQCRMHFFRFTNRFLQLTSASEQLLELLM